uniref:Uncharacterized protein n=1 Tax=Knipowitschia caucasica TaxID=637954 RepID=A0AAV2KLL7_KNICA
MALMKLGSGNTGDSWSKEPTSKSVALTDEKGERREEGARTTGDHWVPKFSFRILRTGRCDGRGRRSDRWEVKRCTVSAQVNTNNSSQRGCIQRRATEKWLCRLEKGSWREEKQDSLGSGLLDSPLHHHIGPTPHHIGPTPHHIGPTPHHIDLPQLRS